MANREVNCSPMGRAIYLDALQRMAGGAVLLPHEQEMLAMAPLPEIITSPFTDQESNLLETLRATAKALDIWDEEVRKIDYFTKHFTDLSKMIMQGVTTLGRGLASLHAMGEDLSLSPKSIQDLIMIASYHFRKSYLGVLQTVKKYPEISTRLLANQVNWANMIFRLNMTKVKLEKPAGIKKEEISNKKPIDGSLSPLELNDGQGTGKNQKLDDGGFTPLEMSEGKGMEALSPVAEAATIGASRAFSPLSGTAASETVSKGSELSRKEPSSRQETAKGNKKEEIRNKKSRETDGSETAKGTDSGGNKKEEIKNKKSFETDGSGTVSEGSELSRKEPVPTDESPIERALTPEREIKEEPKEPKYMEVIKAALERNRDHPDRFAFTLDDLRKLTSDPEFCRDEPEAAEQFRFFLMRGGP